MPRPGLPHPILALIGFLLPCLALSAFVFLLAAQPATSAWYDALRRPAGASPVWLPAAAALLLSPPTALAAWRAWRAPGRVSRHRALLLWGWRLVAVALWAIALFGLHRAAVATALVLFEALLGGLVLRDLRLVDRAARFLMAPSLLWVCYATWLTAGIAWLNPA